jgi:hypothetical protein
VAVGGTFYSPSYIYTNSTELIQKGDGDLYATGDLISLLKNAAGITISATLSSEEPDPDAGAAAILDTLRNNLVGQLRLTGTANSGVTDYGTDAYVSALGITATNYMLGSANFGTGIFHDGQGNFTTDAALASSLGFDHEVTFALTSTATVAVNRDFIGSPASATYFQNINANMTSGTGVSGNYGTGIFVSGSTWTSDATIASSINAREIRIDVTGMQTRSGYMTQWSPSDFRAALSSQGFVSGGLTADMTASAFIWVSTTDGNWTHVRGIGSALIYDEVKITLSADTLEYKSPGSDDVMQFITSAWLSASLGTLPTAAQTIDLWLEASSTPGTDGSAWTTDATLASRFNSYVTGRTMNQLTVDFSGVTDWNEAVDKVHDQIQFIVTTSTGTGTKNYVN